MFAYIHNTVLFNAAVRFSFAKHALLSFWNIKGAQWISFLKAEDKQHGGLRWKLIE